MAIQVTPAPMSTSAAQAKESADAAEFLEILCSIGRQAGGPGETSTSSRSSGSHSGSSSRSRSSGSGSSSGSSGSGSYNDNEEDEEEEGVDDSKNTHGTRDTLLTHQTSATIDTVMTGDHVNALLKVHQEEKINRRWSETADTMIGDMINNEANANNIGQVYQVVVPEDSIDGSSPKPRFSIKQGISRRASSQGSFETLDKSDKTGDKDFLLDPDSDHTPLHSNNGPMGGNPQDHPLLPGGGISGRSFIDTKSADNRSTYSGKSADSGDITTTMDNRTMSKLLFMNDDEPIDKEEDANNADNEYDIVPTSRSYQNIRGSFLNLKENLAERAGDLGSNLAEKAERSAAILGDMLQKKDSHEGPPQVEYKDDPNRAPYKDDPTSSETTEKDLRASSGSTERPKYRQAKSNEADETINDILAAASASAASGDNKGGGKGDVLSGSFTYKLDNKVDLSVPTYFNDGRRPRNRRTTVESDMWTAADGHTGVRRASNDSGVSYYTAGTAGTGGGSSDGTSYMGMDRRASNESDPQAIGAIDEECQALTNDNGNGGLDPENDHDGYDNDDANESNRTPGFMKSQGSLMNRRPSVTPFIDEDGIHHGLRQSSNDHYRPGRRTLKRCCGVLIAVGVITLVSSLVGVSIGNDDEGMHEAYVPINVDAEEGETIDEAVEDIAGHGQFSAEALYQMAESVSKHCDDDQLRTARGRWECQQICHEHMCCFEFDGDERHDERHVHGENESGSEVSERVASYSCYGDESKLCRIFADCEVLVLKDYAPPPPAAGGQSSTGSAAGAKPKPLASGGSNSGGSSKPASKSSDKTDGSSGQKPGGDTSYMDLKETLEEEVAKEDLGWQDIRKRYIDAYCEKSNIESKAGRKQCSKLCENHFCCFDTSKDGYNCQDDKSMTCHVYEGCGNMIVGLFDNDEEEPVENDQDQPDGGIVPENSPPGMGGPLDTDSLPFDPMIPPKIPTAVEGEATILQGHMLPTYTTKELTDMKADIKQRCADYRDPTAHMQCEKACNSHLCCVLDGEDSCREDKSMLCFVYDACKVLKVTGKLWQEAKKEETPAKAELISIEEEHRANDDQEYVDHDATAAWAEKEKAEKAKAENAKAENAKAENDKAENDNTDIDVDEDLFGEPDDHSLDEPDVYSFDELDDIPKTSSKLTPQPSPKPAVALTPRPTAETAQAQTISTSNSKQVSATTVKVPPPPIRCIPEGDDEVHVEVYTDDWNDDRYDRCKRWENKHGITVAEYWDMQGIDSDLEKNILENMLLMDNAKVGASDTNPPPAFDLDSLPPPKEPTSLDELDDAILGDEEEFEVDVLFEDEPEDELKKETNLLLQEEELEEEEAEELEEELENELADDDLFNDDDSVEDEDSVEEEDGYSDSLYVNRLRRKMTQILFQ